MCYNNVAASDDTQQALHPTTYCNVFFGDFHHHRHIVIAMPTYSHRHAERDTHVATLKTYLATPPPPQDEEHPELASAVKLKIADLLRSGDEAARAAVVRDVERSALQVRCTTPRVDVCLESRTTLNRRLRDGVLPHRLCSYPVGCLTETGSINIKFMPKCCV